MQINPPSTATLPGLTVTPQQNRPIAWQAGQHLTATVLDATPDGHVSLRIQGQVVDAHSPLPLVAGEQLKLIAELDAGQTVLRVIAPPTPEQTMAGALRTALPKQIPLVAALRLLARLLTAPEPPLTDAAQATTPTTGGDLPPATPLEVAIALGREAVAEEAATPGRTSSPAETPPALPPKVRELLQSLLERLPTLEQATTADGLRSALNDSGLFLQARLARGDGAATDRDLQSALLRLAAAAGEELAAQPSAAAAQRPSAETTQTATLLHLGQTLQQIAQQADGAVAHLRVQQLHTLAARSDTNNVWLLNLPIRHGTDTDVVQLRIRREARGRNGEEAPAWSVHLHFGTPHYGAIDSVVNLSGGNIGVTFWSDRTATATLLQQHMEGLRAQLQQAGLAVEQLRSVVGKAPRTEQAPAAAGGLLHLRA